MRGPIETVAALGLPAITGVLQVGASVGQELEYFFNNGIRYGAFLEPLDAPFELLKQRCSGVPGYVPVQILCGSRDQEEVTFHVASNFGQSSSMLAPTGHLNDYPTVQFSETTKITTFTLDRVFQMIEAHRPDVAPHLNLLFMDVQGAELRVLKGANSVLQRVDYIHTEVGLGGGYEGDALFEDMILYLKAYDFRLCSVEMNPEGWGDAIFIRRTGRRWVR